MTKLVDAIQHLPVQGRHQLYQHIVHWPPHDSPQI